MDSYGTPTSKLENREGVNSKATSLKQTLNVSSLSASELSYLFFILATSKLEIFDFNSSDLQVMDCTETDLVTGYQIAVYIKF